MNFQPATAPVPLGYFADTGAAFGDRGNGHSYGCNGDNVLATHDANSTRSPDQRYDTFIHLQPPELRIATWELAVPNGSYRVHVVSGDPTRIDSVYRTSIGGAVVLNGTPTATRRWLEGWRDLTVTDGRLTLTSATGARNNKINLIDVIPLALAGI